MRSARPLVLILALFFCAPARAAEAPFFAGRTINLVIGFGPGGANDIWARTIAKRLGDHIAGRPRIVPQN